MAEPVLVTGATGKTGRAVAALLGDRARPVSRSTALRFDWHDAATWPAVTDGVIARTSCVPTSRTRPSGSRRSSTRPRARARRPALGDRRGRLAGGAWERRVERAVTERVRSWTLLRATWFQQVLTDAAFYRDAIRAGELALPSRGAAIAWVDARDIAAVAVAALADPAAHAGRAYDVTGPEALSVAAVAERLSAVTGRDIRAGDPAVDDALAGYDPWLAGILRGVFARVHDGTAGAVTDDVRRVTGRAPRTLDAFLTEHRDAVAPVSVDHPRTTNGASRTATASSSRRLRTGKPSSSSIRRSRYVMVRSCTPSVRAAAAPLSPEAK